MAETSKVPHAAEQVISYLAKRIRKFDKKITRINETNEKLDKGNILNEEQKDLLAYKPIAQALHDELEDIQKFVTTKFKEASLITEPETTLSREELTCREELDDEIGAHYREPTCREELDDEGGSHFQKPACHSQELLQPNDEDDHFDMVQVDGLVVLRCSLRAIPFSSSTEGKINLPTRNEWVNCICEKKEYRDDMSEETRVVMELERECLSNLITCRSNAYVLRLLYVADTSFGCYWFLEKYISTLRDIVKQGPVSSFWQHLHFGKRYKWNKGALKEASGIFCFNPFLRQTTRCLLEALIDLYTRNVAVDLSLDTVVFLEEDRLCLSPKLRSLSYYGACDRSILCNSLKQLLDDIIKLQKGNGLGCLSEDIGHLLATLGSPTSDLRRILKGPAFWEAPLAKRDFILRIRDLLRDNLLVIPANMHSDFPKVIKDWKNTVNAHPYLNVRFTYATFVLGEGYDEGFVGLVKFMRDTYTHGNQKIFRPMVALKEKYYGRWDTYQWWAKADAAYEVWQWSDMQLLFECLFPSFVRFLYGRLEPANVHNF